MITLYGMARKTVQNMLLFLKRMQIQVNTDHILQHHTFQKYKQGTLQLVKHLDLIQKCNQSCIIANLNFQKRELEDLYIRLIKIELRLATLSKISTSSETSVMLPGIKEEPGILVMYTVAEKGNPTRVSILEVYENLAAYHKHIKTPHYWKYKEDAKSLVKSLKFIDVDPILLGSKPQ